MAEAMGFMVKVVTPGAFVIIMSTSDRWRISCFVIVTRVTICFGTRG